MASGWKEFRTIITLEMLQRKNTGHTKASIRSTNILRSFVLIFSFSRSSWCSLVPKQQIPVTTSTSCTGGDVSSKSHV